MSHATNSVDSVVLTEEEGARLLVAVATRVAEVVTKQGASAKIASRVPDIANRAVIGAFVSFKRDGSLRSCMGCLAESMLLGDAVEQATWRAVHDDPRFPPITSGELNELTLEVWLLWGMTEVQVQGAARREAVVIGRHGVQITCGNNRGLLLPSVAIEHRMDAEMFLEALCQKAGLPRGTWQSASAKLSTFEGRVVRADFVDIPIGDSLEASLATANNPESRLTAVAGSFYPANATEMNRELDRLWKVSAAPEKKHASAILLPHAGWVYSGVLAAKTLQSVIVPQRVIVFAPKHTAGGIDWSVAPYRSWRIPGGEVQSDQSLVTALGHKVDLFHLDEAAHEREHAIEVLLPMLSRCQRDLHIAGVTLASAPWHLIAAAAEQLAEIIRKEESPPLLVISSDLNHFATQEQTLRADDLVLDAIATLDPERVLRVVHENKISMCGVTACVLVMETLRHLGCLNKSTLVGHTTSAAVSGDTRKVVGYAGVVFE